MACVFLDKLRVVPILIVLILSLNSCSRHGFHSGFTTFFATLFAPVLALHFVPRSPSVSLVLRLLLELEGRQWHAVAARGACQPISDS